jgi:hypothetical protein
MPDEAIMKKKRTETVRFSLGTQGKREFNTETAY